MADHTTKNIETLAIGDSVLALDSKTEKIFKACIEGLERAKHHDLVRFTFEDGSQITSTQDHPFLLQNSSWAAMKPKKSVIYQGFDSIQAIAFLRMALWLGWRVLENHHSF